MSGATVAEPVPVERVDEPELCVFHLDPEVDPCGPSPVATWAERLSGCGCVALLCDDHVADSRYLEAKYAGRTDVIGYCTRCLAIFDGIERWRIR